MNIANAPYECKRSKQILKVKRMQTADVRCIGVLEGDGANKGKLGAITFEFINEGKIHTCNSVKMIEIDFGIILMKLLEK